MPDCTLTDAMGGALTVGRGGFGSDNVVGDLTDGGPVGGATVVASNVSTSDNDQGTTDSSGNYSMDINLAAGHTVRITASWIDASGRTRRITGTCTVT